MNLIFAALGLVSIMVSLTAKPLGQVPYRWGVYVALTIALGSLNRILSPVPPPARSDPWLILLVIVSAIAAAGILLRRKFGVVAFAFLFIAILITPFIPAIRYSEPVSPSVIPVLAALSVYAFVNAVYFRNRWALLT